MSNGDLGLVDTVGAMQLAIQAAISEVFSSKIVSFLVSGLTFNIEGISNTGDIETFCFGSTRPSS